MNAAFKYFSVKWTLIAFIPDSNKEQRKKLQTLFGWAASCMCLKSLSEVIWVFILLSVSNASWRTTVDSYTFRTESLLLLVFHLSTDLAPQNQCCWHLENRNKKYCHIQKKILVASYRFVLLCKIKHIQIKPRLQSKTSDFGNKLVLTKCLFTFGGWNSSLSYVLKYCLSQWTTKKKTCPFRTYCLLKSACDATGCKANAISCCDSYDSVRRAIKVLT